MKKFVLVILLGLLSTTVSAQVQWYKATEFAYRVVANGLWTDWSSWQEVSIDIKFDISNDLIVIYSDETQIYRVVGQAESIKDSKGNQIRFRVIDQDHDVGHLRLRMENSGGSQIYIDFSDISWVYNVRRSM